MSSFFFSLSLNVESSKRFIPYITNFTLLSLYAVIIAEKSWTRSRDSYRAASLRPLIFLGVVLCRVFHLFTAQKVIKKVKTRTLIVNEVMRLPRTLRYINANIYTRSARTRGFLSMHSSMLSYVLCNNSRLMNTLLLFFCPDLSYWLVGGERISSKRRIRDKQKGRPQHPPSWVDYAFRPALDLFSLTEYIFDEKEKLAIQFFVRRINFFFLYKYTQHFVWTYSHRLIRAQEE